MTKKICFYSWLSSGHLNICVTLAKSLLNNNDVEVYFIVDREWESKLAKLDERFKFGVIEYDNGEQKNRVLDMVNRFEDSLKLPLLERLTSLWKTFLEDKTILEIDIKSAEKMQELRPDVLLCDQVFHLPSMYSLSIPFFFIVSANPLAFNFDGFPKMGMDTALNDKEEIQRIADAMKETRQNCIKLLTSNFQQCGVELPKGVTIEVPLNPKTAAIYAYRLEVDYYNEEMRVQHALWQIDSPISEDRIPKPFEMPADFKRIPGKTVYVSLGSLFSAYVGKLQRLVDILEKIPNVKFIVSKGPNGDKLKFPSDRFIGENYVDQLAVLQVVDLAILHGGYVEVLRNNSFCEAFHFGVPQIIIPVLGDQINNAQRIVETGFGYKLGLLTYTEEELVDTVTRALNNEELRAKLRKAGQRIQLKNKSKLDSISSRIANYKG